MQATIKHAANGFIVSYLCEESGEYVEHVFEYEADEQIPATFKNAVSLLQDILAVTGSRHDAKRYYGIVAPGDKHSDFEDYHADAIWGKDE